MTATAPDSKAQRKKTRIAHMMLPQIDADSALLPPDRWIVKTTWELIRDNKSVHQTVGGMAGFALAGIAAITAGVVGVLAVAATAPAIAIGVGALAVAGFFGYKTRSYAGKFKAETLPSIRDEVGKKYLDYKMTELKQAWQRNMEEKRKQREAEKAAKAKAAAEAKASAPKVEETAAPKAETPKVETPKAAEQKPAPEAKPVEAAAAETKAPEKKTEKKTLGGAFGEWALKQAAERARKLKEKEQKDDSTPPATPPAAPKTPKP